MAQAPQTTRGQRSRARIVDAAASVMLERGIEATTCEQILDVAGASKSQLYHYFDGKEDLVHAVITRRCDEVIATQLPHLDELDSLDGIRRWFDRLLELNRAAGFPGCVLSAMSSEIAGRDDEARALLAEGFDRWEAYLVDGLVAMHGRGELADGVDPHKLANATFATVQGGLLQSSVRRRPALLEDALDAAHAHLVARSAAGRRRRR